MHSMLNRQDILHSIPLCNCINSLKLHSPADTVKSGALALLTCYIQSSYSAGLTVPGMRRVKRAVEQRKGL